MEQEPPKKDIIETSNVANSFKNTASIIGTFFLWSIGVFLLLAGGSLMLTMDACKNQSTDCGAGWAWGFLFLPVSFFIALIVGGVASFRRSHKIYSNKTTNVAPQTPLQASNGEAIQLQQQTQPKPFKKGIILRIIIIYIIANSILILIMIWSQVAPVFTGSSN